MFSSAARSIHWARNFLCCVEEGLKALIMCGGSIALWSLFGGVIAGERVLSAVQILWLALFIEVASSIGMTNSYFTGDLPKPTIFTITAKQFFFRCVPQMCYNLCVFLVVLLYGPLFLPGSTTPAECTSQPIYPSKVPSGLISNFVPPSQRHPCLNSSAAFTSLSSISITWPSCSPCTPFCQPRPPMRCTLATQLPTCETSSSLD
jgi:hypothetical protein